MSAIADGIDFLVELVHGKKESIVGGMGADRAGQNGAVGLCYLLFAGAWFQILGNFSSMDFSAIATAGSLVQCLGFLLLSVKVSATKSVAGLSSKTLTLFVLHFTTRLTSTSMKNGYIPVDATGDYIYQLLDFFSLLLVLQLLFRMHKTHAYSYQEEFDTLPIVPIVIPCIIVGIFIHGNFNKNFFFDTIWQISANFEAFTMVPQLWMMARMGGKVDSVTSHFVACTVISAVLQFTFWWWTAVELNKRGPCLAYPLLLCLQIFKLLLGADFMYYYTLACFGGRDVVLPDMNAQEF